MRGGAAPDRPSWPPDAVVVRLPWLPALSKNRQHRVRRRGLYLTAEAQAARDTVAWLVKAALGTRRFPPTAKLWLALFVDRPDLRQDPINVLDAVADAVKGVVGVDDRYFAVAGLDWALVAPGAAGLTLALWADPAGGAETGAQAASRETQ